MLQLEVFINNHPTGLVAAFNFGLDGKMTSSRNELDEIGLRVPEALARQDVEVPLDALPGVAYRYDGIKQTIYFTVVPAAQKPTRISGQARAPVLLDAIRPPFGTVVNYTLFGSGGDNLGGGAHFESLAGSFEARTFGAFGLVENDFVRQFLGKPDMIRLNSSYVYEDPAQLQAWQAGDLISGGFSWTRPIRMGGIQISRSFGLRPDIVTLPIPTLAGSAAAPSTLDLYINGVQTLSAAIPQGPYEVDHAPLIYGGGQARIVLRDALGRESVSTTPFYVSPNLLAPGLTDFSTEVGFARRNYAIISNDYDSQPVLSASWRHGLTTSTTIQAHTEDMKGLASAGGGAVFTIGTIGLASVATSGSRTPGHTGALVDAVLESHMPHFSIILHAQRATENYEDLASRTAVVTPDIVGGRRDFGPQREINQVTVTSALPLVNTPVSASYIQIRQNDDTRSRIINFSVTHNFGHIAFFATAIKDLGVSGSAEVFAGFSIPLGKSVTASTEGRRGQGGSEEYVEMSKQGAQTPGALGWSLRASEDDRQPETEGTARYSTSFARFEVEGEHTDNETTGTAQMEGALTVIDGGLYATPRLDDAFALVDVGVPNVSVTRENRYVGVTDSAGKLLVPNLTPFVANRIAIDPAGLPLDAKVSATEATTIPFSRTASRVDMRVDTDTNSALLTIIDPDKIPIELGSSVRVEGQNQDFVVGYDGQVYLEELAGQNAILVTMPGGAICRAQFSYHVVPGEQVHIDAVVCSPVLPQ